MTLRAVAGLANGGSFVSPSFTGTPQTSNLKFNNIPSADPNTLDYYEEGNWTPAFSFSTTPGTPVYTTQAGRYTRIGNKVFCNGRIGISSKGGGVGNLAITGLPFIVATGIQYVSAAAFGYASGLALTAGTIITGFANPGSNRLILYKGPNTGVSTTFVDTDGTDTMILYFSLFYEV